MDVLERLSTPANSRIDGVMRRSADPQLQPQRVCRLHIAVCGIVPAVWRSHLLASRLNDMPMILPRDALPRDR